MGLGMVRMKIINFIKENIKNFILLLIPIFICMIIYLTPSSFQEPLVLNLNNINWWSWFAHIFLHQNLTHIFMNVLIYVLAIISAYVLTPKEDRKRFVWILYTLIILIPLLTLLLIIYFRNIGLFPMNLINNRGFSGISAGALGVLGFAISKDIYLKMGNVKSFTRLIYSCDYIFVPTLAIMVLNLNVMLSAVIGVVWLLLVASWVIPNIIKAKKNGLKLNNERVDIRHLIIPMLILFIGALLMVPKNLVNGGSAVNTPAHLFGFSIAFILSFIIYYFFSKK